MNFDLQRTKDDLKKLDRTLDKFALTQNVKDLVQTTQTTLQDQIDTKVDITAFTSRFTALEETVTRNDKNTTKELAEINQNTNQINQRLDRTNIELRDAQLELQDKVASKEGQEIWANFSKFAVYDDLRDLYQRCVPAISSFEDKLKLQKDELTKYQEILIRFDEHLTAKSAKVHLEEFKTVVRNNYLLRNDIFEF